MIHNMLIRKGQFWLLLLAFTLAPLFTAQAEITTYTYDDDKQSVRVDVQGGVLSITSTTGNGGTITPLGRLSVAPHNSVTYTITADEHYSIQEGKVDGKRVEGISSGTSKSYTFSDVITSHTIDVTFKPDSFDLNVSVTNAQGNDQGGTVTSSPAGVNCGTGNTACKATYNYNTVVTLTAAPSACSTFTGWSGTGINCAGTGNCALTMDAAKTVTATFDVQTFVITPIAGPGGSISPSAPVTASRCSSKTFTITADAAYHIKSLTVGPNSVPGAVGQKTYSHTISDIQSDQTINVQFEPDTVLTVNLNIPGAGTVTSTPTGISCGTNCSSPYSAGQVVKLVATSDPCYSFTGWSGACTGTIDSECNVAMDSAAKSVTANFVIKTYTITTSTTGCGDITPSGQVVVNCGSEQVFTMLPNGTDNCVGTVIVDGMYAGGSRKYTFENVRNDHTIQVGFSMCGDIRIKGTPDKYYSTIQGAYDDAVDGDLIQCTVINNTGDLVANQNKAVTLEGGYDSNFVKLQGVYTPIKGMFRTQSGGGTLTIKNFMLNKY